MRPSEFVRPAAVGTGIAALISKVDVGLLFAPWLGLRKAGLITVVFAIVLASGIVAVKRVGERCRAHPSAWISFGTLGFLLLAHQYFSNSPTLFLLPLLVRLESSVVLPLLWLALLPLTLIVSAGVRAPSDLHMPFSPRLWIVLTLFFGMTFDFATPFAFRSIGLPELLSSNQPPAMSLWPLYVEWLMPAALAFWGAKWLDVYVRKPAGLTLATVGMIYFLAIEIWTFLQFTQFGLSHWPTTGFAALLLLFFVMSIGPHMVIAHALIAVGTIWMLFSGEENSRYLEENHAGTPAPAQKTAVVHSAINSVPTQASHLASRTQAALDALIPPESRQGDDPLSVARRRVAEKPSDLTRHFGLHRTLLAVGASSELFEHARIYLNQLVQQSRSEQAFEVLSTCLKLDPEFKPAADDVLPLARIAMMKKDARSALIIMRKFDTNHPGHPHTADIFYLCARGARDIGKVEVARTLLKTVLERYGTAPVAHDARTLLAALERSPGS